MKQCGNCGAENDNNEVCCCECGKTGFEVLAPPHSLVPVNPRARPLPGVNPLSKQCALFGRWHRPVPWAAHKAPRQERS
jgi:hypothetical protein